MIETGGFSWLDIVRALCRIVRDSFVQQDCCVMALDDTLLLRSSKTAPGAARRFDHAGKPNRCPGAEPRLALHGHRGGGGAFPWSPVCPTTALTAASWPRSSLAPCCTSFAPTSFSSTRGSCARASSSGPWRVASPSLARRVSTRRSSSARGRGRPAKYGMRFERDKLALLPVVEKRPGVYHNVPIRFRSFRARFLGGLEVRAVWISLRVKGRWTKNRLLLSTDPTMPPEAIIRLYADRWTIEPMFNSLKHAEGVKSLKHAEGVKELWQRSKEAFHRWLHLVQAGMALTVMLSLRDDPDIVRLAHAGPWRREVHPTPGMIKDGLIRRFWNCRVDGLFARKGRKSRRIPVAGPPPMASAA